MTEREYIEKILERLGVVEYSGDTIIEIRNSCFGEDISFEFDENGEVTDIYC